MRNIAALIVAGGRGSRVGSRRPKQYQDVAGVPVVRRTVEAFRACPGLPSVQLVIGPEHADICRAALSDLEIADPVLGGDTRQESVRCGLEALLPRCPDFVLIHDAARPLVSGRLILSVVEALKAGAEAVLPVVEMSDSLKRKSVDTFEAVPREGLFRAQTPQGFRFLAIYDAHRRFAGTAATDDIALAEMAGLKVTAVPGEEINIKITRASDFQFAERLLAGGTEVRTGSGFDVHRFAPGDHVWLCGVRVPHDHGLEGHSDADAGLHALTDAILGALGAGDIGQHFPPSDQRWRGAASRVFLAHAAQLVRTAGGLIANCDVTLICEGPKIGPHRDTMRATIAEILGTGISQVSVKATTTEGLGFAGRGEGLAAQAIATIRLPA